MQTYSHYLLTAAINRRLKKREAEQTPSQAAHDPLPPTRTAPLLLGSIAPDLPLILLTAILVIYDRMGGAPLNPASELAQQSSVGYLFDYLFFNDPSVKALHNLFHGPILTILYALVGYWAWKRGKTWGAGLFWFGASACLHTFIDIPLHYNDGPLIFFPFDWETRFYSPVSYWDPDHYGIPWSIFEHLLDVVLLVYLVVGWRKQKKAAQSTS